MRFIHGHGTGGDMRERAGGAGGRTGSGQACRRALGECVLCVLVVLVVVVVVMVVGGGEGGRKA